MEAKEITTWRDDTALDRFRLISPLLDPTLDRDRKILLRKEIASQNDLSEKTIRRYEAGYLQGGFAGLKPAERKTGPSRLPANFEELMQEAIQLKREVPTRSVHQIIFILEGEGKVIYDDTESPVKAGEVHYCPEGHSHSLINNGTEDLVFYAVVPKQ